MAVSVKPYAFRADPRWHRDDPVVRQRLSQIPAAVLEEGTFSNPGSYEVLALYADGREEEVERERYSRPNPATREEAREFVRKRWEACGGDPHNMHALFGAFRASPTLPLDEQIERYIETSPWVWRDDIDE